MVATFYLLWSSALAEGNRYMVFFTDKEGSDYYLDKPEEFLSPKSLERRTKQNIGLKTSDLPVSESYLLALKQIDGINTLFTTKWFNGVLVEMEEALLEEVETQPYVAAVEFVAPGIKFTGSTNNNRNSRNSKQGRIIAAEEESGAQNAFIGVDMMHEAGYKGEEMLIAVFDSGFEYVDQSSFFNHIFTGSKLLGQRDFIRNSDNVFQYDSHGSKVLSCISAFKDGSYSGTAPEANLVLCVTEDVGSEYRIEEYNWLFAAEYADSIGADIINSSVGYSYFSDEQMDYTYEDMDGKTTIISKAARLSAQRGMLVVTSNGNEGNNSWTYLNAPADADSVLSVGAVTYDKIRSNFSSYGPTSDGRIKPEVSALGSWVKVIYKNEVTYANGTSFSTPLTAGLAAGFWQAFPEMTNIEVISYLKMTASQSDAPDTLIGYGIPDFTRAYTQAKFNEGGVEDKFIVFPNPVTNERIIYLSPGKPTESTTAQLAFYDLKGSTISDKNISVSAGNQMLEIDVSFLSPGTYIMNYLSGSIKQKIKLVVL